MKHLFPLITVSAAMSLGSVSASTILSENFDSYTDTTDLGGTWNLGDGTLDTANGNPGQSLNHPGSGGSFTGANTNSLSFPSVYPSGSEILVFTTDIFDDGVSDSERNSAGIRTAAGANIIEMGIYNSPGHYAFRTVLFGAGSDGSWVAFDNLVDDGGSPIANDPVLGWHRFIAEITDSQVTFSLDLNSDGNINATAVAQISQNGAFEFDVVRLGGPSDLGSSNGGAKFDNVGLALVPEPSSALLGAFALMGLAARRQRN